MTIFINYIALYIISVNKVLYKALKRLCDMWNTNLLKGVPIKVFKRCANMLNKILNFNYMWIHFSSCQYVDNHKKSLWKYRSKQIFQTRSFLRGLGRPLFYTGPLVKNFLCNNPTFLNNIDMLIFVRLSCLRSSLKDRIYKILFKIYDKNIVSIDTSGSCGSLKRKIKVRQPASDRPMPGPCPVHARPMPL